MYFSTGRKKKKKERQASERASCKLQIVQIINHGISATTVGILQLRFDACHFFFFAIPLCPVISISVIRVLRCHHHHHWQQAQPDSMKNGVSIESSWIDPITSRTDGRTDLFSSKTTSLPASRSSAVLKQVLTFYWLLQPAKLGGKARQGRATSLLFFAIIDFLF